MTNQHQGLGKHDQVWDLKVSELVKDQKPVVIDSEMKVEEAAMILVENSISSAPVYNAKKKAYVGMFDYQDLVAYLLKVHEEKTIKEGEELKISEAVRRGMSNHGMVEVKLVSDLSDNNPFYTITHDTSLREVMSVFSQDIHRVVVMKESELIGVLTQSNVMAHLFKNAGNQLPAFRKSLSELKVVNESIQSIAAESSTWSAMSLMHKNKRTSLPILDKNGSIVGSVSLSDIKYALKRYNFTLLHKPVFQFVQYVRNAQGVEAGQDRFPVFEVGQNDHLSLAVGKMVATRAHRVWVVNQNRKCVGCVSLTDALKVLVPDSQ
ncbi:hypothetical protein MIR68_007237 [Amoeboaphelidium protococcarum]|nr:hypothetical protein MIR68_007237 [Amoeboaphelidium protococcarum]KAI3643859.1 hypothetical protein MP228_010023 [Amoeboaphelidium protococcarum]